MSLHNADIEDAIARTFSPELDTAYPGVRERLLAELALLRRKEAALDWLDTHTTWGNLYGPRRDIGNGVLESHTLNCHALDLLSAIEQAKEAGRG